MDGGSRSRSNGPWALNETFSLLRRPFRIQTTSAICGDLIASIFGDCRAADAGTAPRYELHVTLDSGRSTSDLFRDGRPLRRDADPHAVVSLLAWHVMNDAVAAADDLFVVHAGSVVSPGGRAIVLPGASGSGKTTLTAGLVRAGCAYLSDEMAAFDPSTGHVLPVPRALSVKPGTFEALGVEVPALPPEALDVLDDAYPLPTERLRAGSLGAAAPLGAVVVISRAPGAATQLIPMSRAEALSELVHQSFNAERFGGPRAVGLLGRFLEDAKCYRLAVATLDDAVSAVLDSVKSIV